MKKNHLVGKALSIACCFLLSGCGSIPFFDKDNTPPPTPLTNFRAEFSPRLLWNAHPTAGVDSDYLKLPIATNGCAIFTASSRGVITASDRATGRTKWSRCINHDISSGPGAGDQIVVVGGSDGRVFALSQDSGAILWQIQLTNEILAAPAIAQGVVIIKTIDGHLFTLSSANGRLLWNHQQTEPLLILRGASTPVITDHSALVGFANGSLEKISLYNGDSYWEQSIAIPNGSFAVQRMIDIDADPIVLGNTVYAATYQGNVASLGLESGRVNWSHPISSYIGIAADYDAVYVSDACSHVWAFDAHTGSVLWHQPTLAARNITGPALMSSFVVVGDADGYLHWLNKQDGHFVARTRLDSSGILATPVMNQGTLYVVSKSGNLAAYR